MGACGTPRDPDDRAATGVDHASASGETWPRGFMALMGMLLATGLVARVTPLFDQGGRILRQFPTEDGYLMLTIARNIALGNGMSTANGTIPTNGTQPLTTLIWAGLFRLVQCQKQAGVLLVQVFLIMTAAVTAYALYCLAKRLLEGRAWGKAAAALAACAWYASSMTVVHTQNCLETGVYVLLAVLSMLWYVATLSRDPTRPGTFGQYALLGVLLGLTFLARNDACWLILAFCLVHVLSGFAFDRPHIVLRLVQTLLMGLTSVVISLPWLIFNQVKFGSVVPISGISEAHGAALGDNLNLLPATLTEYVLAVLPVPWAIETQPIVIAACSVILLVALAVYAMMWTRASRSARVVMGTVAFYALGLSGFYGLYFGASYFMNRYLFPLSPFLAIAWAALVMRIWLALRQSPFKHTAWVLFLAPLILVAGFNARTYIKGKDHMHWQVVQWVATNVKHDEWVGAGQSGTLGFFHDLTINLDGKVNPEALEARLKGKVLDYVVRSEIRYLVDWVGITTWGVEPPLKDHFEVIVEDQELNLGVLRRKRTAHAGAADDRQEVQRGLARDGARPAQ